MKRHRLVALLYFSGAMILMPTFGAWIEPHLLSIKSILCWAITSGITLGLIVLLFKKTSLLTLSLLCSAVVALHSVVILHVLSLSPYAIAILGAWPLALGIVAVNEYHEVFPALDTHNIEHWFEVGLLAFTIFISASVVGFILSWYQSVPNLNIKRFCDAIQTTRSEKRNRQQPSNNSLLLVRYEHCRILVV